MPRINRKKSPGTQRPGSSGIGYDGKFEIGGRVVEDPFDPENTIVVPVNVRHDPLLRMFGQKDIDTAQLRAGEILQAAFEAVNSSGVSAVDTRRDVVDGGPGFAGISDHTLIAARKLREAESLLGWQSFRLVVSVVCQGLNGSLIAQQSRAKVDRKAVAFQVRNALEQLAILWGLTSNPAHVRKQASMVGMVRERAGWTHAETDLTIRYAERG